MEGQTGRDGRWDGPAERTDLTDPKYSKHMSELFRISILAVTFKILRVAGFIVACGIGSPTSFMFRSDRFHACFAILLASIEPAVMFLIQTSRNHISPRSQNKLRRIATF